MSNYVISNDGELYHYGVKGMKWGKRKARGHAGPGIYITRKRQLAGDKRDLAELNKGKHLSVGLTKKRQAAFDARDKAALEKRIAKNEAAEKAAKNKAAEKAAKKALKKAEKAKYKEYIKTRSKEINAGESFVGKAYNLFTDAHKIQADIEYAQRYGKK